MAVLDHLEPKGVFGFFEAISAIPRGSRNCGAVSDWCAAFARERGLECHQDSARNVVIIKPASPGYEAAEPVILQGHLDMVCEKEADCPKDMEREGLDLAVEGGAVYAKGTTLGGDDGIAVAMALAILDDPTIPHPRLEVVLTTEEEIGMLGAAALDVSPLRGRQMINLDSECEGVFTVSCAGGSVDTCALPVTREPFAGSALTVRISGLTGGHSGTEIHRGRANANLLLGRVLSAMEQAGGVRLVSAAGGLKDNAVPVAAEAVVVAADGGRAEAAGNAMARTLRREYPVTDPDMRIEIVPGEAEMLPMDAGSTRRAIGLLVCAPGGVQAWSQDIPEVVQTSLNLGILKTEEKRLSAVFCLRSSAPGQMGLLHDRLARLAEQLGGAVTVEGEYPAWEYRRESPLRARMAQVFREQYGREPKVEAIHAGLECGLLCGKLPELDCVSIGPDLAEIHTPRERMDIASVQRLWNFLLEVLRRSREI